MLVLGHADSAEAVTLEIWKAGLKIEMQVAGTLAKRTLKDADVINLVLGRPLSTKVDKSTEILALAGDAATPGPQSQLVVFDPTAKTVTTTVWTFSNFTMLNDPDFTVSYVATDVSFVPTTLGTPVQNGFLASTLAVAGVGKFNGGKLAVTSTALAGPVGFDENGTTVSGIVLKGKFKTSGFFLAAVF